MIQFREKAGRTDGQTDGRTDDTEFIRPHYRGSKKHKISPLKELQILRILQVIINKSGGRKIVVTCMFQLALVKLFPPCIQLERYLPY